MIDVMDGLMTCYRRILTRFDKFTDAQLAEQGQTWNGTGVLSCFFHDIAVPCRGTRRGDLGLSGYRSRPKLKSVRRFYPAVLPRFAVNWTKS